MRLIGYDYEADTHCIDCTYKRFDKGAWKGREESWMDDEGNRVQPRFDTDETDDIINCGDCHEELT